MTWRVPAAVALLSLLGVVPRGAEARRRVLRPLVVARAGGEAAVRKELARTRVRAGRVADTVDRADAPRARKLLGSARDLLRRADEALAASRPKAARDLTYRAQRLLSRAEEALRRVGGKDDEVRSELRDLDARIAKAERSVRRGDAAGRRLLSAARDSRKRAAAALQSGDARTARRHIRAGRRAALRALERSGR